MVRPSAEIVRLARLALPLLAFACGAPAPDLQVETSSSAQPQVPRRRHIPSPMGTTDAVGRCRLHWEGPAPIVPERAGLCETRYRVDGEFRLFERYEYDAIGRVTALYWQDSSHGGIDRRVFDDKGRLVRANGNFQPDTEIEWSAEGIPSHLKIRNEYSGDLDLRPSVAPGCREVTWTVQRSSNPGGPLVASGFRYEEYDELGRTVAREQDDDGDGWLEERRTYVYAEDGRRTETREEYSTGWYQRQVFDESGRVTLFETYSEHGGRTVKTYSYDAEGNRITPDVGDWQRLYDTRGRVIRETRKSEERTWTYCDPAPAAN